jgi:hypothetical protein
MSEESNPREFPNPDIFGPPFFGVGLGEKLGSLDARLIRVEKDISELKGKVDEIAHIVTRHDERFDSLGKRMDDKFANMDKRLDNNAKLMVGLFTALFVAIIAQKFF